MMPLMCIEVVLRMPALFLSPLRFLFQLPAWFLVEAPALEPLARELRRRSRW